MMVSIMKKGDTMTILILMGVSGCGKTTLGKALSEKLNLPYFEADDLHPEENIRKMSSGIPLTDDDRRPWLERIRSIINTQQNTGESAVISCSALKESYRQYLQEGLSDSPVWVYLKGSFDTLAARLENRKNHFFKKEMLESQFAALEEPEYGIVVDIELPLEEKISLIMEKLEDSP